MSTDLIATRPASFATELRTGFQQAAGLLASGWARIRSPRQLSVAAWVTLAVWSLAIAGDAYTTLSMMGTGMFEEGNAVAAAGMRVVGPAGYVAAASAMCVVMAVASVGKWAGRYATTVALALMTVGAMKLYVAAANAFLWVAN